jgi:hypothetical protein
LPAETDGFSGEFNHPPNAEYFVTPRRHMNRAILRAVARPNNMD